MLVPVKPCAGVHPPSLSLGEPLPEAGREPHRHVDLDAVAVPSGLVHLRYPVTAEGVVGDFQGVREGVVIQKDSGGQFLWAKSTVLRLIPLPRPSPPLPSRWAARLSSPSLHPRVH